MAAASILTLVNTEVPTGTSAADLATIRGALDGALMRLARIKVSCHDCAQWDIDSCTLYGSVPADFQKLEGQCADWRYDGVPW